MFHQGYAYVEFASPEVAGIVASTMNGYFLYNKQLVCRVLKFEEIHPRLFDGSGHKFRKVNWHGLYKQKVNADRCVKRTQGAVFFVLACCLVDCGLKSVGSCIVTMVHRLRNSANDDMHDSTKRRTHPESGGISHSIARHPRRLCNHRGHHDIGMLQD